MRRQAAEDERETNMEGRMDSEKKGQDTRRWTDGEARWPPTEKQVG